MGDGRTSVGIFGKKDRPLSRKEVERALGAKWDLFQQLTALMEKAYRRTGERTVWENNYG